ncbi:hypothetical protein [Paenibacillus maysiensis]|uniref:hypothetical protein n=1 Tax=Paenibacillus maysiensis TaxID=1155954 RepID=UPI00046E73F1|nr:hypothetical protein [Paenibacillus maysiensis]
MAQSTADMDWSQIEWRIYGTPGKPEGTELIAISQASVPMVAEVVFEAVNGRIAATADGVQTATWKVTFSDIR